jgi:4-hydroxymandelate synthase
MAAVGMSKAGVFDDLVIDHIEFYVSDLDDARRVFSQGYGFDTHAASHASCAVALGRGDIRLLLTEASASSALSGYVERHGDGVAVIALGTADAGRVRRYGQARRCAGEPVGFQYSAIAFELRFCGWLQMVMPPAGTR